MIKRKSKTYESETVLLDGHSFENCTFKNCTLEFRGTDAVSLVGNNIQNCQWSLSGPAALTISFLKGLYQGAGPTGQSLVDSMFKEIREPVEGGVKQK